VVCNLPVKFGQTNSKKAEKGLDHLADQLKRPAFSWKANALIQQYHPLARMGRLLRGLAQVRRVALSRNLLIPDPDLCSLCSAHQLHYNRGIPDLERVNSTLTISLKDCDAKSFYVPRLAVEGRGTNITWGHADTIPPTPLPFQL
jgi:ABC-type hemin transport system ATPase subunit